MKLYSGPLSLFARKVEIALQEKGLAFEREMVSFSQTTGYAPKHPVVLAANPKGQVPVLVDDAVTLFDSTVIFEYLEEAYPLPPLYPADPEARARCRLLELTADEIVLAPVRSLMYRSEPPSPDPRRWAQREDEAKHAEALLVDHYRALQERLGMRRHFCNDFSVADIALYLVLFYAQRLRGPDLTETPRLAVWYERVAGRPAVARVAKEIALADHALSPALAAYAR
ncbi:MAG: glutathione S-transferase family protein [Kiloniellales bacterium]